MKPKILFLAPKRKNSLDTWEHFYNELKIRKDVDVDLKIVYYIGDRVGLFTGVIRTIFSTLNSDFDIIYAKGPISTYLAKLICKIKKKPFVAGVDDYFPGFCKTKFKKMLFGYFEKSYKKACQVITIDPTIEKHLKNIGIQNKKLHIVPHATQFVRNNTKKRGKKLIVGYVGVLGKVKGFDIFSEAIKYVKSKDIEFHIVGTGSDISDVIKQKNVIYHGFLTGKKLADYIKKLDLLITPYNKPVYKDPSTFNIKKVKEKKLKELYLPTKVIEAFGLNVPVIFPNFREFKDYSSVLVFFERGNPKSLASVIEDCYSKKINYQKKIKLAHKLVKDRTWKNLAEKRLEIMKICL